MEKQKFIQLFQDETFLIFERYNLNEFKPIIEEIIILLKEMDDSFVKKSIRTFANAIHKGEVTNEILSHNLNEFKSIISEYKNNNLKEYLNINVDPTLYMEKEEIENLLVNKFNEKLKKTEILRKEEESPAFDPSMFSSMFGGMVPPGFRQRPTSKKYKPKKKK